jgi:hypothetical protein
MPGDLVQIGPFQMPKVVLDTFAPLLGVLIGGLISYLATITAENRRWEQHKKDKLQEQCREAIGFALDWITPLDIALRRADSLIGALYYHRIDGDKFMRDWPDLITQLKDPPRKLQVLLPPDTYSYTTEIIRGLEELRAFVIFGWEPKDQNVWQEEYKQCSASITYLKEKLDTFSKNLVIEYNKTFS